MQHRQLQGVRRRRLPHLPTRGWRLATGAGALALAIVAFGAWRVYSYTTSNPSYCLGCHAMQRAWHTWATSSHSGVPCQRCHAQTAFQSADQLYKTAVRRQTQVRHHGDVPDGKCRRCHLSGDARWVQVARTAGHRVHVQTAHQPCIRCHNSGLHRFQPRPGLCRDCHANVVVRIKGMGSLHCLACHDYMRNGSGINPLQPTRQACLACHQQMGVVNVSFGGGSPMQFPCAACHRPHSTERPQDGCTSCHPEALSPSTPEAHRNCTACHQPHSWRFQGPQKCLECHSPLPGNVQAHQIPNHPERFCVGCHQPHGWRFAGQSTCAACHRKMKAVPHPTPWVKGHQQQGQTRRPYCRTCHEDTFCASCHARMKPASHKQPGWAASVHGQQALRNTTQCATCHAPTYCSSCHGTQMPHPQGWLRGHATPARNRQMCQRCHTQQFCTRCHVGPKMMPPDHAGNWTKRHGKLATSSPRCLTCHQERECDACHGTRMPHPAGWLPTGHAAQASFRPNASCFRCHQANYCYRACHKASAS